MISLASHGFLQTNNDGSYVSIINMLIEVRDQIDMDISSVWLLLQPAFRKLVLGRWHIPS